jgi:hypothetical protein
MRYKNNNDYYIVVQITPAVDSESIFATKQYYFNYINYICYWLLLYCYNFARRSLRLRHSVFGGKLVLARYYVFMDERHLRKNNIIIIKNVSDCIVMLLVF